MNYIDCWISVASQLFSQALAGSPKWVEREPQMQPAELFGFTAELAGDVAGRFSVSLDAALLAMPLLGEGVDQKTGWGELLREVAGAAAGELLARAGLDCQIKAFVGAPGILDGGARAFALRTAAGDWTVLVKDETRPVHADVPKERAAHPVEPSNPPATGALKPGVELLLDVELEATLRFGCREVALAELVALGPGDVLELDRQVTDPVDLIVGDKIVARGDVVLVDGNFGLRVTEVAAPRKRLESIRCLY